MNNKNLQQLIARLCKNVSKKSCETKQFQYLSEQVNLEYKLMIN
jgi:hypothetical protein